jgi:hypothetical protein
MLRPSLSSRRCFRLVQLTISFDIKNLAILSKVIHYTTTCIANGIATRTSNVTVPTSPPLPHFGSPLGAQVHFVLFEFFRSFILMFFN